MYELSRQPSANPTARLLVERKEKACKQVWIGILRQLGAVK